MLFLFLTNNNISLTIWLALTQVESWVEFPFCFMTSWTWADMDPTSIHTAADSCFPTVIWAFHKASRDVTECCVAPQYMFSGVNHRRGKNASKLLHKLLEDERRERCPDCHVLYFKHNHNGINMSQQVVLKLLELQCMQSCNYYGEKPKTFHSHC